MAERARDLLCAAVAFALAMAVGLNAFGYPLASSYFPRTLALIVGGLALLFAVRAWRRPAGAAAPVRIPLAAPLATFAGVALYAVAIQLVGFQIATFVFLAASMVYLGHPRRPVLAMAIALAVTAGLYAVFFLLLGVPAPDNAFF